MDKWEAVLSAMFPDFGKYGKFVRVKKETRWGPEWQLRFRYLRASSIAAMFAEFLLKNLPTKWPLEKTEFHFIPDIKIEDPPEEDDEYEDPFKF